MESAPMEGDSSGSAVPAKRRGSGTPPKTTPSRKKKKVSGVVRIKGFTLSRGFYRFSVLSVDCREEEKMTPKKLAVLTR